MRGVSYIAYTGDGPYEAANLSCRKARRIATGRCVRGGTYTDDDGHTQWRYFIGWYPYVPH